MNLARGTLTVERSKTDAGVRVVDLTPALREELALWLDRSRFKEPTDLVFPTLKGRKDCRQNVGDGCSCGRSRRRTRSSRSDGIEPIGTSGRTASDGRSRRCASLPATTRFTSRQQLGHEDPTFTLRVYAQVVKHRERLTAKEREAFEQAVEWARMGTNERPIVPETVETSASGHEESRRFQRVS